MQALCLLSRKRVVVPIQAQDESGKNRKLSRPWHGPYHVCDCPTPDAVASKVYFPDKESIRVHQIRTVQCPLNLPNGYYWYGRNQASPQKYPRWVEELTPVLPGDAREEPTPISSGDESEEGPKAQDIPEGQAEEDKGPELVPTEPLRTGYQSRYHLRDAIRKPKHYL